MGTWPALRDLAVVGQAVVSSRVISYHSARLGPKRSLICYALYNCSLKWISLYTAARLGGWSLTEELYGRLSGMHAQHLRAMRRVTRTHVWKSGFDGSPPPLPAPKVPQGQGSSPRLPLSGSRGPDDYGDSARGAYRATPRPSNHNLSSWARGGVHG